MKERIEEMAAEGLEAAEITDKLNAGEAELPEAIPISQRRVREIVADWELANGPVTNPEDRNPTPIAFARLRHRIAAIVQREIVALEQKKPGKLTHDDLAKLNKAWGLMANFEVGTERLAHRRPKKAKSGAQTPSASEAESALERLAGQMGEATAKPLSTDAPPQAVPTRTAGDRAFGQSTQREQQNDGVQQGPSMSKAPVIDPAPGTASGMASGMDR